MTSPAPGPAAQSTAHGTFQVTRAADGEYYGTIDLDTALGHIAATVHLHREHGARAADLGGIAGEIAHHADADGSLVSVGRGGEEESGEEKSAEAHGGTRGYLAQWSCAHPLPLRERVDSLRSNEPGEGSCTP